MAENADNEKKRSSTEIIVSERAQVPEGALKTGVWYPDFARVKAAAVATGKPMFAMWINPGCGFCQRFCNNAISQRFKEWMSGSDMYFWLGSNDDPAGRSGPGWDFVVQQSEGLGKHYFPLCAVWQSVDGKVIHDYRVSGRTLEKETSGEAALENVLTSIKDALAHEPYPLEKREDPGPNPQKAFSDIVRIVSPFIPRPPAAAAAGTGLRIRPNPGMDEFKRIRFLQALAERGGHCPCRNEKNGETVCLCSEFMKLDKPGTCRCGFFEKYDPGK